MKNLAIACGIGVLLLACSSSEEATPCQALFDDICARAVACTPSGPEVVVRRPAPSGNGSTALSYSNEADCRGGANFCKAEGPIAACRDALATAQCEDSSDGPAGLLLPSACSGID